MWEVQEGTLGLPWESDIAPGFPIPVHMFSRLPGQCL